MGRVGVSGPAFDFVFAVDGAFALAVSPISNLKSEISNFRRRSISRCFLPSPSLFPRTRTLPKTHFKTQANGGTVLPTPAARSSLKTEMMIREEIREVRRMGRPLHVSHVRRFGSSGCQATRLLVFCASNGSKIEARQSHGHRGEDHKRAARHFASSRGREEAQAVTCSGSQSFPRL
jgi:hypothetical protein